MPKPREILSKKLMVNNSKLDLAIMRTLATLWNHFLGVSEAEDRPEWVRSE